MPPLTVQTKFKQSNPRDNQTHHRIIDHAKVWLFQCQEAPVNASIDRSRDNQTHHIIIDHAKFWLFQCKEAPINASIDRHPRNNQTHHRTIDHAKVWLFQCREAPSSQKLPMTAPILSQKAAQQLLVDIENIGLPLDQTSLVDLCDAKEGTP
jgi:hypothetical protein